MFQNIKDMVGIATLVLTLSGVWAMMISPAQSEEAVACVCDGRCEHLRAQECLHGLTFDMCRCCLECARGEGEPCGGAVGKCSFGLHCQLNGLQINGRNDTTVEGICSRKSFDLIYF